MRTIIIAVAALWLAGCAKKEEPTPRPPLPPAQLQQPMNAGGAPAAMGADGSVQVGPLAGKVPDGWSSVAPASSMRVAQFALKAEAGDTEGGEVSAFYFGPDAGGVEANIQRWFGQFERSDGKAVADNAKREEMEAGGMKVTIVTFTGTMKASSMAGAPQTGPREGWMNSSAIVMTSQGPWFFKGTGPEKTMKAHLAGFKQFIASLKMAG